MKKILIIDDDMTALDLVDILFERSGYEVVRHTDGGWVIENIGEIEPDVILIDMMMPKMSGDECIRQLRNMGVLTPIVAFTAMVESDVHLKLLSGGADLVLTKPCKPDVLVSEVERVIKRSLTKLV